MSERKVPRIDWAKYRGGRAAGRREAVTVLGDSLRELGCVRVQGHAGPAPAGEGDEAAIAAPATLDEVARGILEALADYFGLPADALLAHAGDGLEPVAGADAGDVLELAPAPGLLLLLPHVPSGLALRAAGGGWQAVAAHPGELLVVAGRALTALTSSRVPETAVRLPAAGASVLPARRGIPLAPLTAFASA